MTILPAGLLDSHLDSLVEKSNRLIRQNADLAARMAKLADSLERHTAKVAKLIDGITQNTENCRKAIDSVEIVLAKLARTRENAKPGNGFHKVKPAIPQFSL